jgi:hypothetical protein
MQPKLMGECLFEILHKNPCATHRAGRGRHPQVSGKNRGGKSLNITVLREGKKLGLSVQAEEAH